MYIHFSGCQSNNAFISITLILSLTCTVVQLTISETGSLLTSGCMTIYATYLCGAAVAKNPLPTCNPMLGETSTWSIVVGLLFALISLTWTGFSYTSDKRLGGASASDNAEEGDVGSDEEEPKIAGGVVLNNSNYGAADTATSPPESATADDTEEVNPKSFGSSWKLNAGESCACLCECIIRSLSIYSLYFQ